MPQLEKIGEVSIPWCKETGNLFLPSLKEVSGLSLFPLIEVGDIFMPKFKDINKLSKSGLVEIDNSNKDVIFDYVVTHIKSREF